MHYSILFYALLLLSSLISANNQGKMIAFAGISGSGKSTIARLLAEKINACAVCEPEACAWPAVVTEREKYGAATAMLAFRQLWAQQYIDADYLRQADKVVFVDTYFFKIYGYYLDKPGMEWLVPSQDSYMSFLLQLNYLDQQHFPNADCVVLFDVTLEDWKLFL